MGGELQRKLGDLEPTVHAQAELKERVIKLYSGVIEFQAQAVCYFFRNYGGQILHDTVRAEDWTGLLGQINQSEKDCCDDWWIKPYFQRPFKEKGWTGNASVGSFITLRNAPT